MFQHGQLMMMMVVVVMMMMMMICSNYTAIRHFIHLNSKGCRHSAGVRFQMALQTSRPDSKLLETQATPLSPLLSSSPFLRPS